MRLRSIAGFCSVYLSCAYREDARKRVGPPLKPEVLIIRSSRELSSVLRIMTRRFKKSSDAACSMQPMTKNSGERARINSEKGTESPLVTASASMRYSFPLP